MEERSLISDVESIISWGCLGVQMQLIHSRTKPKMIKCTTK